MGSVFGKETVLEPAFKTLLQRTAPATTTYQIREYGTRFVGMLCYMYVMYILFCFVFVLVYHDTLWKERYDVQRVCSITDNLLDAE